MQNTTITTSELTTEESARARVASSTELSAHSAKIWSDWHNMDEHIEWVATAPESDIVEWAELCERDDEEQEFDCSA